MGCCQTTQVDHDASLQYMRGLRSGGSDRVLIVGIKDQNYVGKVYLCGAGASDRALVESMGAALAKTNAGVAQGRDEYDVMWDVVWHNTKITTGMAAFSFTKPYFPIGKNVIGLLDALSQHGWVPTAAPNYGGPIGDKASADWPAIIFEKNERYTKESLFIAVKDQNVPGKLCAAGPPEVIASLKASLTPQLKRIMPDLECAFDTYDTAETWDCVWQNTSVTSGLQAFSLAKPYFPKGKTCMTILKEVYKLGWRLVAAPNFGGNDVDWPCFIFRALVSSSEPPALLMGAIKDQNVPGKLCLAGDEVGEVARALLPALQRVADNGSVQLRKDEYDDDWDAVLRDTKMTNGHAAFSWRLAYFPRCDSMMATLNKLNELGWSLAACPNFGGMGATWPTFIWEKRNAQVKSSFVAIKDQNVPGKVCFGGGLQSDGVSDALLRGFKALAGEDVECAKDSWDQTYELCYRNTKMTAGSTMCSMQNAWWPFGFPLEMMLSELGSKGWRAVGGPNFGSGQLSWSALVLEREAVVAVPVVEEMA